MESVPLNVWDSVLGVGLYWILRDVRVRLLKVTRGGQHCGRGKVDIRTVKLPVTAFVKCNLVSHP